MYRGCLLFSLVAVVGCGTASDLPPLGSVSGKLTVDGKPAANMSVEFHPDNTAGTKGPMSFGITDGEGKFKLYTGGGQEGAVVGKHVVVVKCPFSLTGRSGQPVTGDGVGSSASGKAPEPPPEGSKPDCTLALKYESPTTTPLRSMVPAAGLPDLVLETSSEE
jgi:hypothetical protein